MLYGENAFMPFYNSSVFTFIIIPHSAHFMTAINIPSELCNYNYQIVRPFDEMSLVRFYCDFAAVQNLKMSSWKTMGIH